MGRGQLRKGPAGAVADVHGLRAGRSADGEGEGALRLRPGRLIGGGPPLPFDKALQELGDAGGRSVEPPLRFFFVGELPSLSREDISNTYIRLTSSSYVLLEPHSTSKRFAFHPF